MWLTIGSITILILLSLLKGVKKIKKEVAETGGMKIKYASLIKSLSEGDSRIKIYSETSTAIRLGLQGLGGYVRFDLQQGFGVVVIEQVSENNVFGVQKLEWKFAEEMNQEKMFETICKDIAKSNEQMDKNIATKYGEQ